MGRDKCFLKYQGEFLVDRALRVAGEALGGASDRVILCGEVTGRPGIPDIKAGLGPLGGLQSAVQWVRSAIGMRLPAPFLVVLPVDMPLLESEVLAELVTAAKRELDSTGPACLGFEGFELPFALRCDGLTAEVLEEVCGREGSARSLRELQAMLGMRTVLLDSARARQMLNANSPADWPEASAEVLS